MVVVIQPQQQIAELDPDWYAEAEANRQRANASDQALKVAVDALQAAVAVQKIKVGSTTYTPDGTGLVELPQGVVLPPLTTTQRDAITSPTIGQAILNTTTGSPQIYTATGWQDFRPSAFRTVYTASATWTKPNLARFIRVVCMGAGGGGGAMKQNGTTYRKLAIGGCGGGRAEEWFNAADVPATVPVTVGTGGAGGVTTSGNGLKGPGQPGGLSSFGTLLQASGGSGGVSEDPPSTSWNQMGPGIARAASFFSSAYYFLSSSGGGYIGALMALLGNGGAGGQAYAFDNNGGQPIGPGSPVAGGAGASATASGTNFQTSSSGLGSSTSHTSGFDNSYTTNTALTANYTATAGTSRSGTGKCGDGGGAVVVNSTGVNNYVSTGGAGGFPGGGGGGVGRLDQDTTFPSVAVGGAGGRGEVIVDVFF